MARPRWGHPDGRGASAAAALGRPVAWGLPPGDFKDSRAWLRGQTPVLEDRDSLEELGRRLPGPRSWPGLGRSCRRPSRSAGGASSGTSGSDADGSSWTGPPCESERIPTLCHQTILAGGFERTLTICESLDDCDEMEFEYQGLTDRGIDWGRSLQAAVYPSRRPYDGEKGTGNCKEFPEDP